MSLVRKPLSLAALSLACSLVLPLSSACSTDVSNENTDPRASVYFEVPEWRPVNLTQLSIGFYNSSKQSETFDRVTSERFPEEKFEQVFRNFVIADNFYGYRPYGVGPDSRFGLAFSLGHRWYLKSDSALRNFLSRPTYSARVANADFGSRGFLVLTTDHDSFDELVSLIPTILDQGLLLEEELGLQCRYYRYSQGNGADDLSGIVMLDDDGDARLDLAVEATRTCIGQLFAKSMGLQLTTEQLTSLLGFRPDHSLTDGSCEFVAITPLPSDQRPQPLRYDGCPTAPDFNSYALSYFLLGREDRETAGGDRIELMRHICREQVLPALDVKEYCSF